MTPLNEADTRAKLIDPKLKLAGWGESHIEREHYCQKRRQITAGRIYLVGEDAKRRAPKRVDYVLRYHGEMIAVLEAKDESYPADAGLEQAKNYARILDLPFAYSSNGHGFVEFDFFLNESREIPDFPSPDELWTRWELNRASVSTVAGTLGMLQNPKTNPLLFPPCPPSVCGKELRYFQEVAVRRTVERAMRGQKRILLSMATGTGKTFTAFQAIWKLKRAGWLKGRVLFIADRTVLRDQAYNVFAPFASADSDPRVVVQGGDFNANRELYFATYQALDSGDSEPLYRSIPRDFYGLIVIDECHRSGFGKWNEILRHFDGAIHLGMTATPKRDESIDTYAYFCAEEPEVLVDERDPSKGTWQPPAYTYSLGQGIEDGFLATYKVHRVRTTVDRDGLHIEEAQSQGAEIYVPAGVDLRDVYNTPQFEREISLPDRTQTMVAHLAGLLRRFGALERTMVFCVDMEHARLTARLLQNEFAGLGLSDYAVPIISEEDESARWLEQFQDSDKKTPVVATTAELLSTGVDVPSCRNIVLMKPIASRILFKQIVGRGSRVDPATGKEWFRIIDYVGASRLFDSWDQPPGEPPESSTAPRTSALQVIVLDALLGALLVGASVTVLVGPNEQVGPHRTDEEGSIRFDALPASPLRVVVKANGYMPRTVTVETQPASLQTVTIELKPQSTPPEKIRVRGLEVTIADEATFLIEATGQRLTLNEYLDYSRERIRGYVPDWSKLHEIWVDSEKRREFLRALEEESVYAEVLAEVLAQPEADQFDLLANIAFGRQIRTRDDRADAFWNREGSYLGELTGRAREVVLALLDKYRVAGIDEIVRPEVFRLSPFREMGQMPGVAKRLGGVDGVRNTLKELQSRIYRPEAV